MGGSKCIEAKINNRNYIKEGNRMFCDLWIFVEKRQEENSELIMLV